MSEFASLFKIYDQLEAHYRGTAPLRAEHVEFLLETMRRLEQRADLLAGAYQASRTQAVWSKARPQAGIIAEIDQRVKGRQS